MRSAVCLIVLVLLASSQTQPPDTEIFLAPLTNDGGKLSVGKTENISNSPGYDNQPYFSPDGRSVYFTSARGGPREGSKEAQMDIYRYGIDSRRVEQVTNTPESEYSPTVTPDGRYISVIRVEADKTQRLWKFTLTGASPSLVLTDIKPVGYHSWLNDHTLALFILGEPPTLQIADTKTGKAVVAATDIGRSLQRIPRGGVSFIQRAGAGAQRTLTIAEVRLQDGKPVTNLLTDAAPGATDEFVAWTPDGTLLMAGGGRLHTWRRGNTHWSTAADLAAMGLRSVSRLAVSPRGEWLALVAQSSN